MMVFSWVRKVRPLLSLGSLGLLVISCGGSRLAGQQAARRLAPNWEHVALRTDTLRVIDVIRQRPTPLVAYAPAQLPAEVRRPR